METYTTYNTYKTHNDAAYGEQIPRCASPPICGATLEAMAAGDMTPRYSIFWHEPSERWAAGIDQVPGMLCYGGLPEDALAELRRELEAAAQDDDADGHVGDWCSVCWTTSAECSENAVMADAIGRHRGLLELIGGGLEPEDVFDGQGD